MNETAKASLKGRKYRALAERLEAARTAEQKLAAKLETQREKQAAAQAKQAERQAAASERQKKAADTLKRKTEKVQTYENRAKKRERKLDTRRKILVGALAIRHMQFDGIYAKTLMALLDEYYTSDEDRALLGLKPLPDNDQRRVNPPLVY